MIIFHKNQENVTKMMKFIVKCEENDEIYIKIMEESMKTCHFGQIVGYACSSLLELTDGCLYRMLPEIMLLFRPDYLCIPTI